MVPHRVMSNPVFVIYLNGWCTEGLSWVITVLKYNVSSKFNEIFGKNKRVLC